MRRKSTAGNARLRDAREALGLRSQRAFADAITDAGRRDGLKLSVTERTVRRWESESPPWPQPAHQAALESLLRCPLTDLGFIPPGTDEAPPAPIVSRRAFVALTAAFGAAALTELTSCGAGSSRRPITYAFADEFDGPAGSAPDPSKWGYDLGGGGWGNDELEVYTSSRANSFLDGQGNLVIRATKSVLAAGSSTTTTYQSARLKTLGKFSKYRGTFEARIKFDIQPGLWPAWWLMGANFPTVGWPACGEVDVLENEGGPSVETSVHTPDDARAGVLTERTAIDVDSGWHTWRMQWDPPTGGFAFAKDGENYMTVRPGQMANWCFSSGVPMFMILNLAIGGKAGSPPESLQFPMDLLVDYIRVW